MKHCYFLLIIILLGCNKEKDLNFSGQVFDTWTKESLNDITVKCKKYESTGLFSSKLIDTYSAKTDKNGSFIIQINDYDNENYFYIVTANDYHDLGSVRWPTPPGSYYFYYTHIENMKPENLRQKFDIYLMPCSTIYFYLDTLKYSDIDSMQISFYNQKASWTKIKNDDFIDAFGVRINTTNKLIWVTYKNGVKSQEFSDMIEFTNEVMDYIIK